MTVVQFKKPISAPKNPGTRSKKRSAPKMASDDALIRECIAFAQNLAASDASFDADPTESIYAERFRGPFFRRCNEALRKMAKLSARTAEGLQAKASVVPMVIRNTAGRPDEREDAFFTCFAADVKAFLAPIIQEHHKTAIASKHAASASPQAK